MKAAVEHELALKSTQRRLNVCAISSLPRKAARSALFVALSRSFRLIASVGQPGIRPAAKTPNKGKQ
jgi:hypothetical protein